MLLRGGARASWAPEAKANYQPDTPVRKSDAGSCSGSEEIDFVLEPPAAALRAAAGGSACVRRASAVDAARGGRVQLWKRDIFHVGTLHRLAPCHAQQPREACRGEAFLRRTCFLKAAPSPENPVS